MLEETLDVFINRIKEVVVTDKNMTTIPLAYLMTREIPDSIKHFFDQEVEIWIREEEEKFATTERFDYDIPEVRMLIDQIFDHLKQSATFHLNKFNQLLERAIKLEMNYLIEPHRTLSQFIFKDSDIVSTMGIYDTLKYFFRLEYYKGAISDYFNLKYLREISKDQFIDLINQIDEKAFSENKAETTLKMVKSIMSFLGEAENTTVNALSIDVLRVSLRDRNLGEYVELVERAEKESELSELTFDQLEAMFRDGILPGADEEIIEKTEIIGLESHEDIETSKPEVAVDEIEVQEQVIDEVVVEEDEDEDLDEEMEDEEYELEEETEEAPVAAEEPDTQVPEDVEETFDGPIPNVASDLADHVARQISSDNPLEDLNSLIKGRLRRRIIKKLFSKKEHEYITFIDSINGMPTWKDASRIIDDEFYNREINPYSREAIAFSDMIYLRFFPKDKYVGVDEDIGRF